MTTEREPSSEELLDRIFAGEPGCVSARDTLLTRLQAAEQRATRLAKLYEGSQLRIAELGQQLRAAEADTLRQVITAVGFVWSKACAMLDTFEESGWHGFDPRDVEIPTLLAEVDAALAARSSDEQG